MLLALKEKARPWSLLGDFTAVTIRSHGGDHNPLYADENAMIGPRFSCFWYRRRRNVRSSREFRPGV